MRVNGKGLKEIPDSYNTIRPRESLTPGLMIMSISYTITRPAGLLLVLKKFTYTERVSRIVKRNQRKRRITFSLFLARDSRTNDCIKHRMCSQMIICR
ncbi:unnamed protein product [Allacma fusca]|uniref:Uncharacterized protein n=1 Tax=Allacma fusca TaxID=39272 RepID=A0A8J2LD45_9HEXA|nr:unnamed protein product [Allacma fusca]